MGIPVVLLILPLGFLLFVFFDENGNICDVDTSIQEISEKIPSLNEKKDYLLDLFKEKLQDSGIEFSHEAKGGMMAPYQVDNYVNEREPN